MNEYRQSIKWITRKVREFFPLKDKNLFSTCKIQQGVCTSNENYIGETEHNTEICWGEQK